MVPMQPPNAPGAAPPQGQQGMPPTGAAGPQPTGTSTQLMPNGIGPAQDLNNKEEACRRTRL